MVKTFKEQTVPQYLAIVFNSIYGIRYAKGNTSSKGGSAGNYNLGRIRSFRIPLPPLAEQAAIVERVEALMRRAGRWKRRSSAPAPTPPTSSKPS